MAACTSAIVVSTIGNGWDCARGAASAKPARTSESSENLPPHISQRRHHDAGCQFKNLALDDFAAFAIVKMARLRVPFEDPQVHGLAGRHDRRPRPRRVQQQRPNATPLELRRDVQVVEQRTPGGLRVPQDARESNHRVAIVDGLEHEAALVGHRQTRLPQYLAVFFNRTGEEFVGDEALVRASPARDVERGNRTRVFQTGGSEDDGIRQMCSSMKSRISWMFAYGSGPAGTPCSMR